MENKTKLTNKQQIDILIEKENLSAQAIVLLKKQLTEVNTLLTQINKQLNSFYSEFDERLLSTSRSLDTIRETQKYNSNER